MAEYTRNQKKIIERYYDQRDTIMLGKLSELVTELYLADGESQLDKLWDRAGKAMKNLKIKESISAHILQQRSPEVLAKHVKDWMDRPPSK